jgi:hypothetical protein
MTSSLSVATQPVDPVRNAEARGKAPSGKERSVQVRPSRLISRPAVVVAIISPEESTCKEVDAGGANSIGKEHGDNPTVTRVESNGGNQ